MQSAEGEWRDVAHLSEAELADLVRRDGVQILVELTGHTANNRLGVCALRPAPVQVLPRTAWPACAQLFLSSERAMLKIASDVQRAQYRFCKVMTPKR